MIPNPCLRSARTRWLVILLAAGLLATPSAVSAQPGDHPPDKPIQVGTDFGIAPFVFRTPAGPEGFSVDMIKEVARRIKRPGVEIADMNMADLKGKVLAVNRGTISDTWATENAAKYGFEVQRYDNFPDSVQAVITRRAFAALNEIPTANFAATQNPQIEVGFAEYTGRNFGFALRLESVAFRNQVEEAIECMKLDGWLVKNYEKWFKQPAPNDPGLKTVFPGWGPPGLKGHDPTPHTPKCN